MLPTRSSWISFSLHVLFVALLCLFTFRPPVRTAPAKTDHSVLVFHPVLKAFEGRGGGAQASTPATHGGAPPVARRTFTPPQVMLVNTQPKLVMPNAMDAPPDLTTSATIGDPNSLLSGLSGGLNGPHGIGNGTGPSIGNGPGRDGDANGGIFTAGHGVTMPVPIFKVDPEYSEPARKAKMSGTVLVSCVVGPDGLPLDLRVVRSMGLGLDEKALEAVARWRFRPGTKAGRAVAVKAVIEVSFRIL